MARTITYTVSLGSRGPAGPPGEGGGTTLTSYATQIATLGDYPATFPADHAPVTVSGNGISLSGQQVSLSIGTGETQVAAGNHTHAQLHDAVTVSGNGLSLSGQQLSLSIGTGATQVAAGNDSRFTDARTPTAHKSSHATGGSDAMTAADIGAVATTGNETIAGAKTFSGQMELTGQAATNDTSAMTRGMGDARYGNKVVSFLSTDGTPRNNTNAYADSGIQLTIPTGTWQILGVFIASNATSSAGLKTQCTFTGGSYSEPYGIVTLPAGSYGVALPLTGDVQIASGGTPFRVFNNTLVVTSETLLKLRFGQVSTTAADTTPRAGSYLMAIKIA